MTVVRHLRRRLAGGLVVFACMRAALGAEVPAEPPRWPGFTPAERAWIAAHPVVRVEFDASWKPVEYIENGKMMGLASGYLDAVSRISGLRFELAPTRTWAEGDQAFLAGKIDLIPTLSKLKLPTALSGRIFLTTEYFVSSTVVISRPSERVVFNLSDLDGMTVAVKAGGAYEELIRQHFPGIHLLPVASPEAATEAVLAGDAEAAVDLDYAMEPLLRRRYFNRLHVAGVIVDMPVVLAMGVRNDQPLLWSVMDKSLRSLTAAETDRIMHTWLSRVDYGAPSYRSILHYHADALTALALGFAGVLLMAWRARVQRRRAERSERDKARFLAVMSHEIRTPMNAILASVELLQRTALDARQKRLADVATTASQTLLVLLDDVLDISKLEARGVELELLPTRIVPWAGEALDVVRWRADRKGLTLALATGIDPALCLRIDPTRTRQILLNLLSNALKFTERGGVTVRMSYVPAAKAGMPGTLTIEVADTGIGIAPQDQRTIFNAFQQADSSTTRRFGGTGLGLTISRKLAQLMRGRIALQSTPGVGTVFTVRIPAEAVPADAAEAMGEVVEHPAPARAVTMPPEPAGLPPRDVPAGPHPRPRVLVVDDHPTNLAVLEQQLHLLGCDAELAADGQQALDKAAAQPFHLILLDCHLPDIDGYTVAERIRARAAEAEGGAGGAHTPILAISAATDEAHQQRVMDSGMDGMLTKPIRLDALREMIELWCDTGAGAGAAAPTPALAGEDRDLWSIYLDSLDDDLESLAYALDAGDPAAARYVAHRIKGAALTVGQTAIAGEARALETALAQASRIPADAPAALASLRAHRDTLRADSAVH